MMTNTPIILPGYQIAESIYECDHTLVYRGRRIADKQSVIIKVLSNPHPNFNELVQFRNQYVITRHLDSPYIVKPLALERYENGYAIIMPDDGAVALSKYWQSSNQNLHNFLSIAIQLAEALHYLNQQHIIHKDIKPANILIQPEIHQVQLIDFSIASLLPKEQQHLTNPNILEGTLAYISPEQTGRMNRGIDYRTDFYSLGVTFFELLTGTLPYSANDPMELVHCHIAQIINFPEESPLFKIPNVLQAIVLKLMAKNAEERYQSALGLKHDLEQCQQQLETAGQITSFELGERDICDRFLIPEKLYGRENEVKTLLDAFKRVAGQQGSRGVEEIEGKEDSRSELLLVTGFSGIGKTAVVNEIHKPITRQHGYFIKGKYDQFNRNIPFSAFVQAFRSLMGQLLGESDAELRNWKTKILDAVGESGQVIIEVIPELEHIIGAQLAVPELSGSAAQNRFNLLFGQFVQVFTTQDHPLVIFLDDLQWVDSASLKLLKLLMNESEAGYLLVLGAYRDNEVYPAHPLMLTLDELQKQGATLNTLTLNPLNEEDVTHLVADTLLCSTEIAIPLSQLVYQKTQGNPFFTLQFLQGLYDDGWIEFERERGYWQSDLTKVRQLSLTDDVVEFMVERLRKLPEATQEILKLAACIGNQFSLGTLAIVCEDSQEDVAINLWQALQEGFVVPESEIYKFFQGDEAEDRGVDNIIVNYHFLHDRVQQAAYALIDEDRQKASHLSIGKLLHATTSEPAIEERIFEIVNHLNLARELIVSQSERDELAQLNWIAGQKAKHSTAYRTAMNYLSIALESQDNHCWQQDYSFTLNLHLEAVEVAYLSGNFSQMEQLANEVLERVKTPLEAWKIYEVKILAYEAQGRALEAVEMTLPFLKTLGIEFPQNPSQSDILQALKSVNLCLEDKTVENLVALPLMQDPRQLVVIHLLMNLGTASYFAVPQLTPLLMAKAVCLSIEYGNSVDSSFAYSAYAFILCGVVGDIETGYQFGQLAVNLLSQFENKSIEVKTLETVNVLVLHWRSHLRSSLHPLLQAYQVGLEVGELNFAGLSAMNYGFYSYFLGAELSQLTKELAGYSQVMKKLKQTNCLYQNDIFRQAVINLSGEVENPCDLAGDVYDERRMIPQHEQDNEINILGIFHLNKLILHCLFDQSKLAVEQGNQVKPYLGTMMGRFLVPIFRFYQALALLANDRTLSDPESEQWWAEINEHQQEMEKWAQYAPMNFLHKFHLMTAEEQRVLGKKSAALDFYDQAIAGAKENGYIQEEALANELAAKFYLAWGKEKVAAGYLQDAYYCYTQWGAKAKTDNLENRYPHLLEPILVQRSPTVNPMAILKKISNPNFSSPDATKVSHASSLSINNILDFVSILKASQSFSETIHLNELLHQLTQIILQYSGGDRCALILPNPDNVWQVEAIATLKTTELCSEPFEEHPNLPIKLIQYVKNTQKMAVIDNLNTDLPVVDEYLSQQQPKSLLGLPIFNQGQLIGILYLGNQATSGAFTADRLLILNFLCTQAAVSLENARLYQELDCYSQTLEIKVEERTAALQEREIRLRESEQRYASLASAAPVGIFRTDALGKCIYVNERWCQITGLSPEKAIKEGWTKSLHPEDRDWVVTQWYQSVQQNLPCQIEFRFQRPTDGRVIWVYGQAVSEKDAQGQVTSYVGTITDINDRKQAEIALENLIAGTAATTGQDFFSALVCHIAEALNVSYTLVTEKIDDKLKALAFWANGVLQPTFTYDFTQGPCGQAVQHGQFYCESSTKEKFPEALVLADLEVESYLGIALYNAQREVIGDLCILHNQIIPNPQRAKEILQVFAARAAAELERQRASTLLEQLNQSLETKVEERTAALWEREIHLQESQQQYASLATAAPVGIFRTDALGKCIYVNDRWCKIAGLAPEEAFGEGWVQSIYSDDRDRVHAEWNRSVQENLPFQLEYRFQRPDGKQTWVYGQSIAEYDAQGQVMGYVGTITDISHRKQAEAEREKLLDQLAQLNRELEQANQQLEDYSRTLEDKVEARTVELKTAQEQIIAQEKLASLGTLTAGIAHELRNPLNFVKNYAEGSIELSQDLFDELQPLLQSLESVTSDSVQFLIADLQENASTIRHHSQRAAQIIDSMMQHVRLDYEQTNLQPTHLHDLLDQAVKLSYHIKREQNDNFTPSIRTDYDTSLELVEVVPGSLMQAFINLIDNAYDAMNLKQRQLNIDSPQNGLDYSPTLLISTRSLEEQVEIRIRDNGCGIDPEIQSQILDPFFTTKPAGEGTGLGLSITHDIIVKQHQGALTLETKLGEFTDFALRLPVK